MVCSFFLFPRNYRHPPPRKVPANFLFLFPFTSPAPPPKRGACDCAFSFSVNQPPPPGHSGHHGFFVVTGMLAEALPGRGSDLELSLLGHFYDLRIASFFCPGKELGH